MEFDFTTKLGEGCRTLELPEPDVEAVDRLFRYFKELKHWSRKINLVSKGAGDSEILEKHFLDSLTLLPLLTGENPHLLDIGTGAGFPGLVCKAAMPELKVTLVEPRLKRVSFLRHVIRLLKLQDVEVLECRAEDEDRLSTGSGFTHITSRAVSEIKLFLALCSRFAKPETKVICMKGPKWKEELMAWQANARLERSSWEFVSQTEHSLPQSKGNRHLLVFECRSCR